MASLAGRVRGWRCYRHWTPECAEQRDDPQRLQGFILGLVETQRGATRSDLREVIGQAHALFLKLQEEQIQEIQRMAAWQLAVWLANNCTLPTPNVAVADSLTSAFSRAYGSSI